MCVRERGREERGIENVWEIDHSPPYMSSREERESGSEIGFCKCVYVRLRERERERECVNYSYYYYFLF